MSACQRLKSKDIIQIKNSMNIKVLQLEGTLWRLLL